MPGATFKPLSRRQVLTGGLGSACALLTNQLAGPAAAATDDVIILETKPGMGQLLDAGEPMTPIWGFDGQVPGPTIRVKQGDEVRVRLKNSLDQATTIHWHGIRIDNAMDGVAGLTQQPVQPGETFDYRFRVPDAGTFWYHPHNRSWEQVARGLYGLLIVEEPNPIAADQDIAMVIDDWRLQDDGQIHSASFGAIHDKAHGGRIGNVVTVNGQPFANFTAKRGERLRVRLLNAANSRVLHLNFGGAAVTLIAVDGQPVAEPQPLSETFRIAPAQRLDVVIDTSKIWGKEIVLEEVSQSRLAISRISFEGEAPAVAPDRPAIVLPQNPLSELNQSGAKMVDLVMSGGAMGRMQTAKYKGTEFAIRDLVAKHGLVWAFNGVAGMPEDPLFRVTAGQTVLVRMVNDTRWPHGMHFHGHHVREVARTNAEPSPNWQDTVLIDPQTTVTVALNADNPGKWMLHCHMLEHQAGGMATWFDVHG